MERIQEKGGGVKTLALCLCFAGCCAVATTLPASTEAEDLAVFAGKVVNIRQLRAASLPDLRAAGIDAIAGKVIQVARGGVLVSIREGGTREPYTTVFISDINGFADGDTFRSLAKESGVLEYVTVLGAKKTVRQFTPPYKANEAQVTKFQFLERLESQAKSIASDKAAAASLIEGQKQLQQQAERRKAESEKAQADRDEKQFAIDAKTVAFYRRKAEAGDALGQYEMALRLLAGKGVSKDEAEAVRLLELAAKQGHEKASQLLKPRP